MSYDALGCKCAKRRHKRNLNLGGKNTLWCNAAPRLHNTIMKQKQNKTKIKINVAVAAEVQHHLDLKSVASLGKVSCIQCHITACYLRYMKQLDLKYVRYFLVVRDVELCVTRVV